MAWIELKRNKRELHQNEWKPNAIQCILDVIRSRWMCVLCYDDQVTRIKRFSIPFWYLLEVEHLLYIIYVYTVGWWFVCMSYVCGIYSFHGSILQINIFEKENRILINIWFHWTFTYLYVLKKTIKPPFKLGFHFVLFFFRSFFFFLFLHSIFFSVLFFVFRSFFVCVCIYFIYPKIVLTNGNRTFGILFRLYF